MKYPSHSQLKYRNSDAREAAPDAAAIWHIETRFRYLADRNEWHCRHVVARASFSDGQRRQHDEIDLDALIHELSDSVRDEAKACGVTFRLEVARNLAQVPLDRVHLRSVLVEMVHDALHGLALGQVEARELVARITLMPTREIEISVNLRR